MTKIYLVRHAEAEGNAYRRIHGQYDSRITENGLRQIEALAKRFSDIPIDACYASDLNRTCMTAKSVYITHNLPLNRDARFREVHLGRWEDEPFGALERFEAEDMRIFNHDPLIWSVEGSETFEIYTARFLQGLREIAQKHAGQTVAIFSHGCMLRGVQYLLSGNVWPPYCDNTAVSLLEYENGEFRIVFMNDNSHLPEEISTFATQKWWRKGGDRRDYNMWYQELEAGFDGYIRDEKVGRIRVADGGGDVLTITELSLLEDRRGKRLGQQLMGSAVSRARKLGKTRLQVCVPEGARCRSFFLRHGFVPMAGDMLEKDIRVPQE